MDDHLDILSPEERLDHALAALLAVCNGRYEHGTLEAIRQAETLASKPSHRR